MHKVKSIVIDLLLLFIITTPAFYRVLNNQYFSVHDDQHIVRLFLLDQGLKQGYAYPRWVDGLGFGFGYPLYNFYPPLIYYLAEVFHLFGFSLIWSIKLLIIVGFYAGALGIYLLVKKQIGKLGGFLSAALFTFFFYHAVLVYVRGALAEFIALSILPFVFLAYGNLADKSNKTNVIMFGISLALLILSHPLVAAPSIFFLTYFFIFYLWQSKNRFKFSLVSSAGVLVGLFLSAFFWIPSMIERKYTLVDKILTSELANYKMHFVYPQQFYYSPWAYGGSGPGLSDGMTFQLGKIHIAFFLGAIFLSFIYFLVSNRHSGEPRHGGAHLESDSGQARMTIKHFYFFVFLLFFSLFMTTEYSSFIWDKVKYLWYLQFPWRFLTFTALFISIAGGYFIFFLSRLLEQYFQPRRLEMPLISAILVLLTIFIYSKYFKPQRFIVTSDKERTSFEEIVWRISRTSYEFVPKGVKTKESDLNTTILAIEKKNLPKKPFEILSGDADVRVLENKFQDKEFFIVTKSPVIFRLNTYNFPGWKVYLNSKEVPIDDKNDFKLITVKIPAGKYKITFIFENTHIRKVANNLSIGAFLIVGLILPLKFKKVNS